MPSFSVLWSLKVFLSSNSLWSLNYIHSREIFFARNIERSAMKKVRLSLALAGLFAMSTSLYAQFADAALSYDPGAGFAAGYTNVSSALGAPALGSSVNPMSPPFAKSQLISIGAGGEITLQMDTPITDNAADPYGLDFIIFANSFFVANGGSGLNETTSGSLYYHPASTLIQVSPDDVNWYTLNPALVPQPGEWFPSCGGGNPQIPVNPALASTDFAGMTLGQIESLYDGSAGGTGYDLEWAQDADGGSADLSSADYVRIEVESGVLDMDAVSVVPEPSAFALISLGAALLALIGLRGGVPKLRPARISRVLVPVLACLVAISSARAVTFTENFTNDPSQNGWQSFGDTNLFHWDSTNHVMDVTWDSSQTNSYFYHPLGTTLTRTDDFTIAFDIELSQADASGYGFQVSLGLFNLSEATNTDFQRSTGENSPDLVEFDYFPNTSYDFGASVWPLFVDTNSLFNYNGPSDYAIYAPNLDDWYHVVMTYTAADQTMITTMTNFEQTSGITVTNPIEPFSTNNPENFTDFRVDTFSISSYTDDGLGDSIYAQGAVGNVVITLPPVARGLAAAVSNGVGQVQFRTYENWNYTLQRSTNLVSWSDASGTVAGNGEILTLGDTNLPSDKAFYRIQATGP